MTAPPPGTIFGLEQIAAVLERIAAESAGMTPAPTPPHNPDDHFANAAAWTNLRQPYLDSIDLGPLRRHIASVEYHERDDASYAVNGGGILMSTLNEDDKIRLIVYDSAFGLEEPDFLSCLVDHERVHVEQLLDPRTKDFMKIQQRFGNGLMDCYRDTTHEMECRYDGTLKAHLHAIELLKAAVEIPAYTRQLTCGAYTERISEGLAEMLNGNLDHYTRFAEAVRETTGVRPKDILRAPDRVYEILKQNASAIDKVLQQKVNA